jgi:hypothetical protein
MSNKFKLGNPIKVADAVLLSNDNIKASKEKCYEYIISAWVKNETEKIKEQIPSYHFSDVKIIWIKKLKHTCLIVNYSKVRARKDEHNRERGLQRLEKQIKAGKITKSNINNKGYNKYLNLKGDVIIEIDYDKSNSDKSWYGIKGYFSNTKIEDKQVVENYKYLWNIEKAFRMSKTDILIRPIYHRLRGWIESHICIPFSSYFIYKELERVLYESKSSLSLKKVSALTHNMYQITYTLPDSKQTKTRLLNMDHEKAELYSLINENF